MSVNCEPHHDTQASQLYMIIHRIVKGADSKTVNQSNAGRRKWLIVRTSLGRLDRGSLKHFVSHPLNTLLNFAFLSFFVNEE